MIKRTRKKKTAWRIDKRREKKTNINSNEVKIPVLGTNDMAAMDLLFRFGGGGEIRETSDLNF